jgi:hypothetical protein
VPCADPGQALGPGPCFLPPRGRRGLRGPGRPAGPSRSDAQQPGGRGAAPYTARHPSCNERRRQPSPWSQVSDRRMAPGSPPIATIWLEAGGKCTGTDHRPRPGWNERRDHRDLVRRAQSIRERPGTAERSHVVPRAFGAKDGIHELNERPGTVDERRGKLDVCGPVREWRTGSNGWSPRGAHDHAARDRVANIIDRNHSDQMRPGRAGQPHGSAEGQGHTRRVRRRP